MKVGYIRVSTEEQNTIRQEVMMQQLNVEKIFIDKKSGKNTNRPQLQAMLSFVREGDTVVVSEISRFGRNAKDLLELIDILTKKGVQFESQKEKFDTTTPAGKAMLTIFAAISQLERDYILERQREGIAVAKEKGVYKGRTPITVKKDDFEKEYALWKSGEITAVTAMRHLNLKPNTFYRMVSEYENKTGRWQPTTNKK
jgi:DNA invertase Pin-like site-specific DNA recombinase